jgi:hypothetical protein
MTREELLTKMAEAVYLEFYKTDNKEKYMKEYLRIREEMKYALPVAEENL